MREINEFERVETIHQVIAQRWKLFFFGWIPLWPYELLWGEKREIFFLGEIRWLLRISNDQPPEPEDKALKCEVTTRPTQTFIFHNPSDIFEQQRLQAMNMKVQMFFCLWNFTSITRGWAVFLSESLYELNWGERRDLWWSLAKLIVAFWFVSTYEIIIFFSRLWLTIRRTAIAVHWIMEISHAKLRAEEIATGRASRWPRTRRLSIHKRFLQCFD